MSRERVALNTYELDRLRSKCPEGVKFLPDRLYTDGLNIYIKDQEGKDIKIGSLVEIRETAEDDKGIA